MTDRSTAISLASEIKSQWRNGITPDAAGALNDNPDLKNFKSVVVDLAYEEFYQRTEHGEQIDSSLFCDNFDSWKHSIAKRIEVHQGLNDNALLPTEEQPKWPEVGENFDDSHLSEELGRGSVGRVFLAEQLQLSDRLMVLKLTMHGSREAETLSKLNHENIVPIYSYQRITEKNLTAIAMPFLGRSTLADYLDIAFARHESPARFLEPLEKYLSNYNQKELEHLGEEEPSADPSTQRLEYVEGIIRLGAQLAEALRHAHSRGIIHADLKPSNVLITPAGVPKLIDFNLSMEDETVSILVGGTLPYMSPEQVRKFTSEKDSQDAKIDERTDLYSLGVILYELLSGNHPFGVLNWRLSIPQCAEELLTRQETGPSFEEEIWKKQPELKRLVRRCLEFAPANRPQNAVDLSRQFERLISKPRRAQRWSRRHRKLVTAITTCFLTLSLLVGYYYITRPPLDVRLFNSALKASNNLQFDDALSYLSDSLIANPDNLKAIQLRAEIYEIKGDYGSASVFAQRAYDFANDPQDAILVAECFIKRTAYSDAIRILENVLKQGVEDVRIYNALGICHSHLAGDDKGEEYLNLAIKYDPKFWPAYYNLGHLHLNKLAQGERSSFEKALSAFEQANKIAKHPQISYLLSQVYIIASRGPEHLEKIKLHLRKAVRDGFPRSRVQEAPPHIKHLVDVDKILLDIESTGTMSSIKPIPRIYDRRFLLDAATQN